MCGTHRLHEVDADASSDGDAGSGEEDLVLVGALGDLFLLGLDFEARAHANDGGRAKSSLDCEHSTQHSASAQGQRGGNCHQYEHPGEL